MISSDNTADEDLQNIQEAVELLVPSDEALADIGSAAARCQALLESLSGRNSELLEENGDAAKQLTNFNIWAAGVGAFRDGHESLTLRLKSAPELGSQISQLLTSLALNLDHIQNHDVDNASSASDTDTSSSDCSSVPYQIPDLEMASNARPRPLGPWLTISNIISNLRQLGLTMYKAGTRHRQERISRFISLERNQQQYQMFEHLAFQKAKHMFPAAKESLWNRVAQSIARRRSRFLYLERHQAKLRAVAEPDALKNSEQNEKAQPQVDKVAKPPIQVNIPHPPLSVLSKAMPSLNRQTDFSRTLATKLEPVRPEPADSVSSTIIRMGEMPPAPLIDTDSMSFFCPYCYLTCPATEADSQQAWHRHLMNDLDPYFCVDQDCEEPFQAGGSFMAWLSHLEKNHTARSWECWHCRGTPASQFTSEMGLEEHLKAQHREIIPESLLPTALKHSAHHRKSALLACPFCGGYPDDVESQYPNRESREAITALTKHVKKHLISTALVLLPVQVNTASNNKDVESVANNDNRSEQDVENLSILETVLLHKDLQCNRTGCDCMSMSSIPSGDFSASQQTRQAQPQEVINVVDPVYVTDSETKEWEFWYPMSLGIRPIITNTEYPSIEDDTKLHGYFQRRLDAPLEHSQPLEETQPLKHIHNEKDAMWSLNRYLDIETPDDTGFRDHIVTLNPSLEMDAPYLINRLVDQQKTRYNHLFTIQNRYLYNEQTTKKSDESTGSKEEIPFQDSPGVKLQVIARHKATLSALAHYNNLDDPIPLPTNAHFTSLFQCYGCLKMQEKISPSTWKTHLLHDMEPFSCTWPSCLTPRTYKRAADWVRHEDNAHRNLGGYKCDFGDCSHTAKRREVFVDHLVEKHQLQIINSQPGDDSTTNAWRRAENCQISLTKRPQDEPCRFCRKKFDSWKALQSHVKKHMEQIVCPLFPLTARHVLKSHSLEKEQATQAKSGAPSLDTGPVHLSNEEWNNPNYSGEISEASNYESSDSEKDLVQLKIGDADTVWEFYLQQFAACQQTVCKIIAKAWVKKLEPEIQSTHPYTGIDESAPGWWPKPWGLGKDDKIPYKEPDHLLKRERIHLLAHILRLVVEPNEKQNPTIKMRRLNVWKLQILAEEAVGLFFADGDANRSKRGHLRELFEVAYAEERLKNENIENNTMVWARNKEHEQTQKCERILPVAWKSDWFTLYPPAFTVCPSCYHSVFAKLNDADQSDWQQSRYPLDKPVSCDYGSCPWYSLALQQDAIRGGQRLHSVRQIADIMTLGVGPPCPGSERFVSFWQCSGDRVNDYEIPGFTICKRCRSLVAEVFPTLGNMFYKSEVPIFGHCVLEYSSGSSGFSIYIGAMLSTVQEHLLPSIADFASMLASKNPCRGEHPVENAFWYFMNEMPEFVVCAQCFNDHVTPLRRQAVRIANRFNDRPAKRPEAACQLHSVRMRNLFQDACESDSLDELREAVDRQKRRHSETFPAWS